MYECTECGSTNTVFTPVRMTPGKSDLADCQGCGETFVTDDAHAVRDAIEKNHPALLVGIPQALKRSIGLASAIYGLATHAKSIDYGAIEDQLGATHKTAHGVTVAAHRAKVADERVFNRAFQVPGAGGPTYLDPRVGVMVVPMDFPNGERHVYVVFRGSRGDSGETLNPKGAGFDAATGKVNIDWNANLFNRQTALPWGSAPTGAKAHEGFLTIYRSVSQQIKHEVTKLMAGATRPTVVVTGHSLGAALSVLCAYHLNAEVSNCAPFCFPFNTPRVGNALFADEFNDAIAQHSALLAPESGSYARCINFTRKGDAVSEGGRKGFVRQMGDSRKALSATGTNAFTGNLAVVRKAIAVSRKTLDRSVRFYQTPRQVMRGGKWFATAHDYTKMQKSILGKSLFEL
jgi:hypothetical protein